VGKNHYELSDAQILWIEEMAPGKRFFGIRFLKESDQRKFTFVPGQFVFIHTGTWRICGFYLLFSKKAGSF